MAQQRGYRTIFTLPDKVSEAKRAVLRAYGAEVVVTPTDAGPDDPRSYYQVAERLAKAIPGGYRPNQYDNPNGPESHYHTTGPEIWEASDHRVTHFVAGIGTGGTISGTGRYLKEASDGKVQVIGADPEGSIYPIRTTYTNTASKVSARISIRRPSTVSFLTKSCRSTMPKRSK